MNIPKVPGYMRGASGHIKCALFAVFTYNSITIDKYENINELLLTNISKKQYTFIFILSLTVF